MYILKELNQSLIKVWNEIYMESEEDKDLIKEILDEHRNASDNRIESTKKYPFVNKALKEICASNIVEDPFREVITSINEASDIIAWYPNTTFDNPEIAIEKENFCANLIGKKREMQKNPYLFHSDEIIGGLFLMGKNQIYPEHYHPAWETWVILSGNARWKLEDGEWEVKRPGEYFTYTKNQVHSMKTEDEPLLSLWAWTGDLSSWAKWR